MKRITIICLILALFLCGCSGIPEPKPLGSTAESPTQAPQVTVPAEEAKNQLQLFVDHYADIRAASYSDCLAVTDLDGNGRCELLLAEQQFDGTFLLEAIYEVTEDKTGLTASTVPAEITPLPGSAISGYSDGYQSFYVLSHWDNVDFTFSELSYHAGVLTEEVIGTMTMQAISSPTDILQTVYWAKDTGETTEDDFWDTPNRIHSDCTQREVEIYWLQDVGYLDLAWLELSYEAFLGQ